MSDWDEIKQVYIQPARKCGKTLYQAEICNELLKGDQIHMDFKSWLGDKHIKPFAPPTIVFDPSSEKVEQIDIPEPAPPQEEWVWIKGYKGTDANMCCRGYQYTLGGQEDIIGDVRLCDSGFHFCKNLRNVFKFYDVGNGNRFFEVEALVKKSDLEGSNTPTITTSAYNPYVTYNYTYNTGRNEDKYTSKSIRFIRELTADEVFAEYPGHHKIRDWTTEQKELAMKTNIAQVFEETRIEGLTSLGYSEPFARYIAKDDQKYKIAMAVGSQPQVSMDVKVMAIFMNNN